MLRKAQQQSLRQIADLIDISHNTIARWEHNEVVPNKKNLGRLADFYGVREAWILFGDEGDENLSMVMEKIKSLSDRDRTLILTLIDNFIQFDTAS